MQDRRGEPVLELLAAAIVRGPRLLGLALRTIGGAAEPNVEVPIVTPPRLHLGPGLAT